MNLLLVHNFYQQPGGEDQVFFAESRLMKDHGHNVMHFTAHNNQIAQLSRLALARSTIWNPEIYRKLRKIIQYEKCDIMHVHNTLPLISPAAYYAAKAEGIAVVQTLHNYRMLCPNAILFRNGRSCEDCIRKLIPWPGFYYACYRKSRMATAVLIAMISSHRLINTWGRYIDVFIALSSFSRQKFIDGGLPKEKIVVKPNFLHSDYSICEEDREYGLFVGRLSEEKGLRTLLRACQQLNGIPLKLIGDGPLMNEVQAFFALYKLKGIEVLGSCNHEQVITLMKKARFVVFPSEWYETFGLSIVEAFACGTPVISSNLGAMTNIVEDGKTGLHFEAGNSEDLAEKVKWALLHPERMQQMGQEARYEYEKKYTAERNYQMLINIYETAIESSRKTPAKQI